MHNMLDYKLLLLSLYYDQPLLERISGPSEALFQGGFPFLTTLRWAKRRFRLVRPSLTTYVTVPGLVLKATFFFSINYSKKYSNRQIYLCIMCLHVNVDERDWLGLHCVYFKWYDRCSNHANKILLCCHQYPMHNLTSDGVSLLLLPDSTFYIVVVSIFYYCRGKEQKKWMKQITILLRLRKINRIASI